MKHVKLFENWAEENAELPEYLDPNKQWVDGNKTIYHDAIWNIIKKKEVDLALGWDDTSPPACALKSFSDYDFWREDGYDMVVLSQEKISSKYRLQDCFGLNICKNILFLVYTNIRSMKGLETISNLSSLVISNSLLENLKYCPTSKRFDFHDNPLLSYYGIKSNNIGTFNKPLCGFYPYLNAGYVNTNIPTMEQLNDPEFNAEIFCYFKNDIYINSEDNSQDFNPWYQVYEDPNNVENDSFLFFPFYTSSENFRTKAKEYIKNLDAGNLDRSDLW